MQDILVEDGTYYVMPIYDEAINANEWNSFCIGSNLKERYLFLVRNGKTQYNILQPKIWADGNFGFDSSMVGPYEVCFVIQSDNKSSKLNV